MAGTHTPAEEDGGHSGEQQDCETADDPADDRAGVVRVFARGSER